MFIFHFFFLPFDFIFPFCLFVLSLFTLFLLSPSHLPCILSFFSLLPAFYLLFSPPCISLHFTTFFFKALHPEMYGEKKVIKFNFIGKHSIPYYNWWPVDERVYENVGQFWDKNKGDLFDQLTVSAMHTLRCTVDVS